MISACPDINPGRLSVDVAALKNCFEGRRCFILGNGPSLNRTNLSLLKNEITIGLNRIYLKFPDMGFPTTFICCVNELVLKQFGTEIAAQPSNVFVSASARGDIEPAPNVAFILSDPSVGFATDLSSHVWHPGATVTFAALQLAFHLGVREVILLGVDHNFVHSGRAHKAEKSTGADPNHFDPAYFGKNVLWQYPDLAESELNYATAREIFRIHGGSVKDATVGGNLRVFERVTGYASNPADDFPSTPDVAGTGMAPNSPSLKLRLYETVLNTRHQVAIRTVAVGLIVGGVATAAAIGMHNPAVLLAILALLGVLGGCLLLFGSFATDWISAWARRRRMKDGQLFLGALAMIENKR